TAEGLGVSSFSSRASTGAVEVVAEGVAGAQHPQPVETSGSKGGVGVVIGTLLRVRGIRWCLTRHHIPPQGIGGRVVGILLVQRPAGRPDVVLGHRGRQSGESAPSPGPGEVAVRVPPWASINAREMVRPMPEPPWSRLRALSPR